MDWRKVVKAVAPVLGTALGGPLGAMALAQVSNAVLGKPDGSEDEIATALQSPDALVKLKEADHAFKAKMAELGVNLEKIAAEDRASARQREVQTQDPTTRRLAYLYTAGYFGALWSVWQYGMPAEMKDILIGLLGVLTAAQAAIMQYYFGSSAGSSSKNSILERVMGS